MGKVKGTGIKRIIKRNESEDEYYIVQCFEDYMAEKEANNLSKATLDNYRTTFGIFCGFFGVDEDTTTDEFNRSSFFKWINTLRQEGYKPTTINHYLRDMRTFFYWLMEFEYISESFKIELIRGQEEQLKFFNDDELAALLEKPKKKDSFTTWRTYAIVNWVMGTGNRAATIVDVKIEDINFRRKEIILHHTKNKKAQTIPASTSLLRVIKEYIRMWRNDADDDEYLFCNIGGQKLTTNGLRQAFEKYCDDREVKHHNIHGLRHSFARGWVKNNGNVFTLQKILGHQSLEMTKKYVKMFSDDIKDDFDKYNPLDTITSKKKRTQTVERNNY